MSFANLNLLPQALSLVPPTPFQYRKFKGNEIDAYGQVVIGYGEWTEAYGIVVPAGKAMQPMEGLSVTPNRVSVFIKGVELDATCEQRSPDQIRYRGRIYNVIQVNDWFSYDDFHNVQAQEVKNIDEADPFSPYRLSASPSENTALASSSETCGALKSEDVRPDECHSTAKQPVSANEGCRVARVTEFGEVVYE